MSLVYTELEVMIIIKPPRLCLDASAGAFVLKNKMVETQPLIFFCFSISL